MGRYAAAHAGGGGAVGHVMLLGDNFYSSGIHGGEARVGLGRVAASAREVPNTFVNLPSRGMRRQEIKHANGRD